MQKKRVLICANPDLNFIDGSSVWAQTITLILAATGSAKVDFIAKSPPKRDELFAPLKASKHISIIDGSNQKFWDGFKKNRLSHSELAQLAVLLDSQNPYDVIIVRGMDIAKEFLNYPKIIAKCWIYLTDIPQSVTSYNAEQRLLMQRIAHDCYRLLCQSEGFKQLWKTLVPDIEIAKISLYSPVIPDLCEDITPLENRPIRAIYAGKFKSDWLTLEMAEAWPAIHQRHPDAELVMIGDKVHQEVNHPHYYERMYHALEHTNGLRWLGAQSRESVQTELLKARVGLSWRAECMNDSLEYSTKILEYGRAGCAAILNRNALHELLLGKDYPLFANSAEEFSRQLDRALRDTKVADQAAHALKNLAERHKFSARVAEMRILLDQVPNSFRYPEKTRVLVAGHDLKFFIPLQKKLEALGEFIFLTDQWLGHNKHDEAQSRTLLEQADVIFCEWCLGNLKWYSQNKKPHQRLVARFHLQERELTYVAESNWDNIDHISYVSEFIRREGQKTFGFPFDKTSVIPNFLDESKFTPKKKTGDARYTLGIIGVAPARKRLDRAIELLEKLLAKDKRYCLRVKGRNPLDYGWLLKRDDELGYYRNIFERINRNPNLRNKVIFDPPADDVNEWFSMIGFILSPSDFESFHMAIGEGMLTNTMPVIWNWDGAEEIWGEEFIVESTEEAAQLIIDSELKNFRLKIESNASFANVVANWNILLKKG